MATHSKSDLVQTLRKLLREAHALQGAGARQGELSRSLGYADGYMRAMLEGGTLTQNQLLEVVVQERTRARGPATGNLPSGGTVAA